MYLFFVCVCLFIGGSLCSSIPEWNISDTTTTEYDANEDLTTQTDNKKWNSQEDEANTTNLNPFDTKLEDKIEKNNTFDDRNGNWEFFQEIDVEEDFKLVNSNNDSKEGMDQEKYNSTNMELESSNTIDNDTLDNTDKRILPSSAIQQIWGRVNDTSHNNTASKSSTNTIGMFRNLIVISILILHFS